MITKTFHLSTLILFASCLAFLQAQDCNNPLLETFNLPGLPNPVSGASLPFCSNLQGGQTCCSNETVNNFQGRLNNLTTSLQNAAIARDTYIAQLREQYNQQYQSAAGDLSLLVDQINNIQRANATVGSVITSQRDQIEEISTDLADLNSNFVADFQNYQNSRVNCFSTLLKIQASAWCLACDPNYASQGVLDNGTIAFAPELCTKISQACYPFLAAAEAENPLFRARQSYQRLLNLLNYIANFTNTVNPTRPLQGDVFRSTNATERTVTIPPGCTDANTCVWQCQNLFSGQGLLNEPVVANGAGQIGGADINFAAIAQTNSRRMLQGTVTTWNPDIEATRMTVVVVPDPANVAVRITGGMRLGVGSFVIGLLVIFVQFMLLQ